ncbi:MAG: metal-dependent hydrolase [Chloroflexi bacterium]|nr:metal-dependent hydrolase [Chloroflexota bacterium]
MMEINLTWYGRSAFLIEFDKYRVLLDPYFSGNSMAPIPWEAVTADLILVSHGHDDHVGDALAIANRLDIPVLTNPEIGGWLGKHGLKKRIPIYISGIAEFPFGKVKSVIAMHGSSMEDGSYGGLAMGFILYSSDGRKIYFAGDTGLFGDMRLIGEEQLDCALLPIGDTYVMGLGESLRAIAMLSPRITIPMHFNPAMNIENWQKEVRHHHSIPLVLEIGKRVLLSYSLFS